MITITINIGTVIHQYISIIVTCKKKTYSITIRMMRCPVKSLITLIILLSLTSFIIILIIIQIDMNGYEAIPNFNFRRPFLIDPNIFMNQIFSITDNRSRRNMFANSRSDIPVQENLKDSNNLTFQIQYYKYWNPISTFSNDAISE